MIYTKGVIHAASGQVIVQKDGGADPEFGAFLDRYDGREVYVTVMLPEELSKVNRALEHYEKTVEHKWMPRLEDKHD